MVRLATGISVYGLSKNNVKSIEMLLPDVDEQTAIAEVLSDMDAELAALGSAATRPAPSSRG